MAVDREGEDRTVTRVVLKQRWKSFVQGIGAIEQ